MGTLVLRGALVAAIALAAVAVAVEKSRSSHPLVRSAEAVILDTDLDGYPDAVETYIGTNPNSACGVESWPPDVDNDGSITILDLAKVASAYGSSVANGDPRYKARYDMDADASISILDLSKMASKFGKKCADLFPYPAAFPQPPNGDFELADYTPANPLYWTARSLIGADYHFQTGTPHTGLSYVSADVYGFNGGGNCEIGSNGWVTVPGVPMDATENYQLSLFAKSDILVPPSESTAQMVIEFDDANGQLLDLQAHVYTHTLAAGNWEGFGLVIGPASPDFGFRPPLGTRSIKIALDAGAFVFPPTCTVGTSYARESFDSVSLVDVSTFTPTPTATPTSTPTATPTPTPTP